MALMTIVTPCLNAVRFVEASIRSVLDQRCSEVEHIVVDGGSTDGTLEILARYPHLKVIERPDSGLYEALNRGVSVAQGSFVGHLNADDCYLPGSFERVQSAMKHYPEVEVISGGAVVGRQGIESYGEGRQLSGTSFDIESVTFGVPAINAKFMARRLYDRIGLYDLHLPRAADREFLVRAILARASNVRVEGNLYWYRSHSGSLTIAGGRRRYLSVGQEHMDIARSYLESGRLTESDAAVMRRWHSEGATLQFTDALMSGQIARAVSTLQGALAVDSLAVPRMLRFGAEKLARLIRAGRGGPDL